MAIGHKTGGRKPGTPNKRTVARQEAQIAAGRMLAEMSATLENIDALTLLQTIYRCPGYAVEVRIDAAKAAAPYERARLQSVDVGNKGSRPLRIELVQF